MSTILFLASRMQFGFGVSLVVDEISTRLMAQGHRVVIGCEHHDDAYGDLDCRVVSPNPQKIQALVEDVGATIICAHTTPYFEVLPHLPQSVQRWAWEHGDPTPDFFPTGREERSRIAENKRIHVYPTLTGVVAISHFIAADIGWPSTVVIPNGADHVTDYGTKGLQDVNPNAVPLGVGTLMRLGAGEGYYKGQELYLDLVDRARDMGLDAKFHIMGRGTEEDAAPYRARGVDVHLNATDEERSLYLRALDVFISPSLWEGCNLPLLEAQASGTAGIAFDTGAHPEMTPLLAEDQQDALSLLKAMADDPGLLLRHSVSGYRFVRQSYRWDDAAKSAANAFGLSDNAPQPRFEAKEAPPMAVAAAPQGGLVRRAGSVLMTQGVGAFLGRARRSLAYRLGKR